MLLLHSGGRKIMAELKQCCWPSGAHSCLIRIWSNARQPRTLAKVSRATGVVSMRSSSMSACKHSVCSIQQLVSVATCGFCFSSRLQCECHACHRDLYGACGCMVKLCSDRLCYDGRFAGSMRCPWIRHRCEAWCQQQPAAHQRCSAQPGSPM